MGVVLTTENPSQLAVDGVALGMYADGSLVSAADGLDASFRSALLRLHQRGELSGRNGAITTLLGPKGVEAAVVVVVGLGENGPVNRRVAFEASAGAAKALANRSRPFVGFYLDDHWPADVQEAAVCGSLVGCQGQDLYRAERNLHPFREVLWRHVPTEVLERGSQLAAGVNLTRHLVNEPPSVLNPAEFARRAAEEAAAVGIAAEVWDQHRLLAERCGSLLAVARGSAHPPRLAILEYRGAGAQGPCIALVGKGVTFDSGGLSLKPTDSMTTMKCDMAGAATVLGAIQVIATRKLPVHVIGLVGLVENMISGDSYRLGDILTARSGKTIEVLNTDAEGRLVLADVLNVALERGADRIIDLATLTGACVVALGTDVAGAMTNHQGWCDQLLQAAARCGEPTWQLPMFDFYREQIKSKVADIKNVGDGRWGGAITAAKFLEEFVGERPWVHLDIAGPSFREKPASWIDAGGTGVFVRTLVELIENGLHPPLSHTPA